MKRILLSMIMIALAGSVGIGATRAYFSDSELSAGNTFSAGTLDLKVDDKDGAEVVHVVKEGMSPKPEWTYQGYNHQWVLKNAGTIPGTVSWTILNVKNLENDCIDPELDLWDDDCGTGNAEGELGEYTWVQWSRNQAPWGSFGPRFKPFNTAEAVEVVGPVLNPGETLNLYMWLDFPTRVDGLENLAQSDSLSFDVEFKLTQLP